MMRIEWVAGLATVLVACGSVRENDAAAERYTFGQDEPGTAPAGWIADWTGSKQGAAPRWQVTSGEGGKELAQLESGGAGHDFPVCLVQHSRFEDGRVSVQLKPISGEVDQAGGVVFRAVDKDNFYVARANALENNVSIYYTRDGVRTTIKYWQDIEVELGEWHTLAVEVRGFTFKVSLDGELVGEIEDTEMVFAGAGMVGVWTKADSVTSFRELESSSE